MRQFFPFFFLLFFCASGLKLAAQASCPPGTPGAFLCEWSCVYCDINGQEDELTPPSPATLFPIESCLNGTPFDLENPRWYGFVAGTSIILFDIKIGGCLSGSSIEAAVVSTCNEHPYKAISCATLDAANTTLLVSPLIVGQLYYLVVDGVDAAQCKYTITVSGGSATPPDLGPVSEIQGLAQVCPGATTSYSIDPVDYTLNYTWTAPPGAKINGGTNIAVLPAGDMGASVEVEFGAVGGQVCVTVSNTCDTPVTKCIQITNTPLAITQLPEQTICYEELPFVWEEQPNLQVVTPGTFTLTSTPYSSYLGCDSIVRQKIIALPRKFKILPTTYLCREDCFVIGGFEYCDGGSYQEVIPSEVGCDSTVYFTLVKVPVEAVAQQPDTITCKNPAVVLTSEGSTSGVGVFYKWVNSSGTVISYADTAVVTIPGEYSLIVTRIAAALACEDTATVFVPINITPPLSDAGPGRVINCEAPVIQLQGSGSPGAMYHWVALYGGNIISGGNTLMPTVNAAGTYGLIVTDPVNGCTKVDYMVVTAETLPPAVNATGGTYNCSVLTVNLQTTTNASGPTFSWSGPNGYTSSEQNPVVNVAGTYTVIVTDAITGCTNVGIAEVEADTEPPGAATTSGVLTCAVTSVTLEGSSPSDDPAFAWTGPNGFTSSLPNPTVSAPGNYVLTVTGQNGCTSTATANVPLDNTPPGAALAVSGNLNCNNATVTITASAMDPSPSLTHTWTLPDGSTVSTDDNPLLMADTAGNYSVLITNTANGCTSTATATVVLSAPVSALINSVTDVLCFGQPTGSASVTAGGGNGTYTYLWSNDATTPVVSNLGPGNYTVTITDGEQCTASATATVTEPDQLSANTIVMPESVNGAADGSATVIPAGGISPYTYLWSNNAITPFISNLAPGFYTVTVTDDNGCTVVETVQVLAGDCGLTLGFTIETPACNGGDNGSATVELVGGNGPFTYEWSSGGTDPTESGLPAGNYTVTVEDANGCTVTGTAVITEPPQVTLALDNVVNTTCSTEDDGSATVNAGGGTGTLSITWDNNQTGPTASNLTAGVYTATATDENGCTATLAVTVEAVDAIAPVIVDTAVTTPLGTTGSVTLSVQSLGLDVTDNCGISSVTFVPATFNCTQLGPHDVVVTATDDAGNSTTETIVVTVVDDLQPTLDCPDDVVRCVGDDIVEYPAPVAMDNCLGIGGSFDMPSGLPSGSTFPSGITTNTFTYTDANANVGSCSFNVTILDALIIELDTIIDDIDNQGIGSVNITVSGSLPGYTYFWTFNGDPIPGSTEDLVNVGAGEYQLVVVDANGCNAASEVFTVKNLSDTDEPGWATGLLIVPNPTSGKLSVIFPGQLNKEVGLTVYDMTGRLLRQQLSQTSQRIDFDLSELPDGMYKMLIMVDKEVVARKIVVSK